MRGYGPSIGSNPSPGATRRPLPMGEVKGEHADAATSTIPAGAGAAECRPAASHSRAAFADAPRPAADLPAARPRPPSAGRCRAASEGGTSHRCGSRTSAARGSPPASRSSPDLLMSPEIEREIENWHRTGLTPYPELAGCPPSGWSGLSRTELRLIHHTIGLSIDLHRRGLSSCTVWAQMLPR